MSQFAATGTQQFAVVSASTNGVNELVAAVAGNRIRVLSLHLAAAGAVNATFKSSTTALTGAIPLAAAGDQINREFSDAGHFETAAGEALNLTLDGAVLVAGSLVYQAIK